MRVGDDFGGAHLPSRRVLLLGGAAVLAGCAAPSSSGSTSAPASSTAAATKTAAPPTPYGSTTSTTEASRPLWAPDANDILPQVKLVAAQHVETTVSQPAVQVVFGQYGGLLRDTASVLVVTHPWPPVPDPAAGSTYDVRLARSGTTWQVTEVHPSTPGPPAATLSTPARQVLAETRIELAPAARADIASGQVHESVLAAMLALSQTYRIGVSLVRSGHPTNVFGTSRPSDHPLGRAFDTWQIDEQSVVAASTPRSLVTAYMQAAARAGSYNVGGPYLPSGSGFFSDDTHHDHVHAGFQT